MKKRGKKYLEAAKAVDRTATYDKAEAVALAKKTAIAKFDETIEVHIRTGTAHLKMNWNQHGSTC